MINIQKIEKDLKIKFKNKSLIIKALTHKSSNQKNNNEKLEFLGDRVIGLVLSKKLFDLYPNETEGVLDKRFAKLVNRKTCSEVAWSIKIQNHIITGNKKKITKNDEKMLSDCCEAVIGAILGSNFITLRFSPFTSSCTNESASTVRTALSTPAEDSTTAGTICSLFG